MQAKKLDLRINLGLGNTLNKALEDATRYNHTNKTAFIRNCIVNELRKSGFLQENKKDTAQ
ncbi:hypothetical protein [Methylobacterium sp. 10]|uniref:hypothetical protein n=1 Tax=Methylobacterium sp. 10 TaxID=1101191 RepID=UPI000487874A|nr:hypothetical protein [Methylobacterium sp. 10]